MNYIFYFFVVIKGVDKGPTNVLIETDDGRTFVVFISEAKGKFFPFNGWSDVVKHLRLKRGCLVILNPLDSTRFKLTYCLNGLSPTCFWTSLLSTSSYFKLFRSLIFFFLPFLHVIPECILPKSHDYTLSHLISTIYLSNKTFHVKIQTVDGKLCFTNGIDVIISQYQLEAGCYVLFTKWFGYSFHLTIFGKNGVEMNFDDVHVEEVTIHFS
ncbi:hypothetical protein Hanom_Chr06g00563471 [Helianthus anomalus]